MDRRAWMPVVVAPLVASVFVSSGIASAAGKSRLDAAPAGEKLIGVFEIDPGECASGPIPNLPVLPGSEPEGSSFQMIQRGGNRTDGPFVENADSPCSDREFTPLRPGSDGGLSTVSYQPNPKQAFDSNGNAVADRITRPQSFFGVRFATSTNRKDPQTGRGVAVPRIVHNGRGKLKGDVSVFAASWNRQHFNQGSPKPDGDRPGLTTGPTGTYVPVTKTFVLDWTSTIVGGPFDGFTGRWHLEGTFRPAGGATAETVGLSQRQGRASAQDMSENAASEELVGTFRIAEGRCGTAEGIDSGSYFQMIQKGGDPDDGPYVENGDSPCKDKKVTPLSPGTDGGLITGDYQPNPEPAFDREGNSVAERIMRPQKWFGVKFSTSSNSTDPQTDTDVPAPEIVSENGKLRGDLRAYSAAWNRQHFNQGSPKPSGSKPGHTAGPTGTYDPATGRYVLKWTSQIEGGPFDGFTGKWHLEGTFEPGGSAGAGPSGTGPARRPSTEPVEVAGERVRAGEALPTTGTALPVAIGTFGSALILLGASLLAVARDGWTHPPGEVSETGI